MTIVEELRKDRESGAKRLEAEYKAGLMTLARRFCVDEGDAEELVNRTFAAVVEGIDDYLEQSAFFGWMCQILTNLHSLDTRRKSNSEIVYPGIVPDMADEDAQEAIYRSLDASLVREAIKLLPEDQRELLLLHYFVGMPVSKIAKFLTIPVGTVNSRLHYARKALAAKLGAKAKKPGGKAVLIALALLALTAAGAAVTAAVHGGAQDKGVRGSERAAVARSGDTDAGSITMTGETSGAGGYSPAAPVPTPVPPDSPVPPVITPTTSTKEQTMNTTARTLLAAPVAAAALAASTASIPRAATGATLKLTTSDGSNMSSFTNWNVSGSTRYGAPSADNDYLVDNNRYIRTRIYECAFDGNSLAFGTASSQGDMVIQPTGSTQRVSFKNSGATLRNGYWTYWGSDKVVTLPSSGPITVASPESQPYRIALGDGSNKNNSLQIDTAMRSDVGTALMLCSGTAPKTPAFMFYGANLDDFHGKMIVAGGYEQAGRNYYPITAHFYHDLAGTLYVQSNAIIRTRYQSTRIKVGNLETEPGAIIAVNINEGGGSAGQINVTNKLSIAPGTIVQPSAGPWTTTYAGFDAVILTFPAEKGTIPLDNFSLSLASANSGELLFESLATNLVDGVWQLVLHKGPHTALVANDSNGTTIKDAHPSALTNATSWLSGEMPRPGLMYLANNGTAGLAANPIIRTPYYANTSTPFEFAGDALILGPYSAIYPCSKDVKFRMLSMSQGSLYILSLSGIPSHLRGEILLRESSESAPQIIQAYMRGLNTIEADIAGSGILNVMGRSGSGNPYGDIEFTALNTNFTGRIKVLANVNNISPSAENYEHERVFVTDARNLGGPLPEFRADALELADYSVLEARNDVDMNVANRGVKVTGNAGFAAPTNVTLAISNDITWNGTARKTGAGTLALGGAPRIASGATAALAVEEGCLAVRATNAVDGVSVTFADGAYLLVNAAATGDVAIFGAVALGANPFGGDLPVAFDFPGGVPEGDETLTVAVATVADAAKAQSLELSARKISEHSVEFSPRPNADGTVTILAKIYKPAFVIVIR